MRHTDHRTARLALIVGLIAACGLVSAGCEAKSRAADLADPPVTVVEIAGSNLKELTLSQRAAERIGVETTRLVEESINAQPRLVVPYAAVLWDGAGDAWVYAVTDLRTYIRAAIVVDRIEDDRAVLSDGPAVGTEVVIVGVAELHGVESGVGGGH